MSQETRIAGSKDRVRDRRAEKQLEDLGLPTLDKPMRRTRKFSIMGTRQKRACREAAARAWCEISKEWRQSFITVNSGVRTHLGAPGMPVSLRRQPQTKTISDKRRKQEASAGQHPMLVSEMVKRSKCCLRRDAMLSQVRVIFIDGLVSICTSGQREMTKDTRQLYRHRPGNSGKEPPPKASLSAVRLR